MINCARCGFEHSETAQYCDECGARLKNAPELDAALDAESSIEAKKESGIELSRAAIEPVASGASWLKEISNSTAASPAYPTAKLIIERGPGTGKEFVFNNEEINIGRWDADNGVFPDVDLDANDPEAKVSRRHARILREGNRFWIEDIGSTNGTFVNRGRRLLPGKRQMLEDGDEIIVGKTFLRFKIIR